MGAPVRNLWPALCVSRDQFRVHRLHGSVWCGAFIVKSNSVPLLRRILRILHPGQWRRQLLGYDASRKTRYFPHPLCSRSGSRACGWTRRGRFPGIGEGVALALLAGYDSGWRCFADVAYFHQGDLRAHPLATKGRAFEARDRQPSATSQGPARTVSVGYPASQHRTAFEAIDHVASQYNLFSGYCNRLRHS